MARRRKSRRTPGEGSVYFRADTGKYVGAVVVGVTPAGNPRRVRKSFESRAEAVSWVNDRLTELHRGLNIDNNATLYEVYDAWMAHGTNMLAWTPATIRSYQTTLELLVLPYLGHVRVKDVSASTVRSLLTILAEGAPVRNPNRLKLANPKTKGKALEPPKQQGPAGIKRAHTYLSIVLNDAVRMGYIQANPALQVTPPTPPEPEVQRWSEEEMGRILQRGLERDDQASRYALIGMGTGLRIEEMLGLTWAAVDLKENILHVEQVASSAGPKTLRRGGKSPAALRALPFDPLTAEVFERQRQFVLQLPKIREEENQKRAKKGKPPLPWVDLDLVFCTRYGTLLDRTTLRRQYNQLQAEAGVERIKLYSTRSTHGSSMADNGENLHLLSERLGHTNRYFTAKKYVRGSSTAHRQAADRFGQILHRAGRGSRGAEGSSKPVTAAPTGAPKQGEQGAGTSPQTHTEPSGS